METLTKIFKGVAHHMLSPTMIIMMAVMALPALTMAAPVASVAGGLTIGDWGLALADHYATMFTASFTEGGTIYEMLSNVFNGEVAANGYEWGSAHAHGGAPVFSPEQSLALETQADRFGLTFEEYSRGWQPGNH